MKRSLPLLLIAACNATATQPAPVVPNKAPLSSRQVLEHAKSLGQRKSLPTIADDDFRKLFNSEVCKTEDDPNLIHEIAAATAPSVVRYRDAGDSVELLYGLRFSAECNLRYIELAGSQIVGGQRDIALSYVAVFLARSLLVSYRLGDTAKTREFLAAMTRPAAYRGLPRHQLSLLLATIDESMTTRPLDQTMATVREQIKKLRDEAPKPEPVETVFRGLKPLSVGEYTLRLPEAGFKVRVHADTIISSSKNDAGVRRDALTTHVAPYTWRVTCMDGVASEKLVAHYPGYTSSEDANGDIWLSSIREDVSIYVRLTDYSNRGCLLLMMGPNLDEKTAKTHLSSFAPLAND